jgi:hypothetical protein
LALPTFGRDFGELGVQKAKIGGRIRFIGIALKQMPLRLEFPDLARSRTRSEVPPSRAAAIEPVWKGGRLTVPSKTPSAHVDNKSLRAALTILKLEITELANDCEMAGNIHPGAVACLKRVGALIPSKSPSQVELFRMGHQEEWLTDYWRTVQAEWPEHLVSRYQAVVLQFTRTIAQFPTWREFKRNADSEYLTPEQLEKAPVVARQVAEQLRDISVRASVDQRIPEALEVHAEPVSAGSLDTRLEPAAPEKGRAYDLIEGINNICKAVAVEALSVAKDAGNEYWTGAKKRIRKDSKKLGAKDATAAIKLARKLLVAGAAGGLGYVLINTYPGMFGWLNALMKVLAL